MTKTKDHSVRAHAVLSASAAYRWMMCTPSAVLTKDMPDETSAYAEEGTKAHELAELLLHNWRSHISPDDAKVDLSDPITNDVLEYVNRAIKDFTDIKQKHRDAIMFTEQKIRFDNYVPEGFGTADLIIIAGKTLYIRDLKFGKGVEVSAENNPQIRCYALGAYNMFEDLYDFDTVVMQIDQVRLNHFSEETMSLKDLLDWANNELAPAAKLAYAGKGKFAVGHWCQFCKAKATCKARGAEYMASAEIKEKKPDYALLTDDEISKILTKAEDLQKWVKALQDYVTGRIQSGKQMPGWKLVEGRSVRTYTDELAVADKLKSAGYEEALIYNRKLIGITEMTKLTGKIEFDQLLGDLVYNPPGKPTLVPESDKRPAINSAVTDFDGINETKEAK